MDVVVSRKLRAPESPELAIGAVGEDGNVFLHDWLVSDLDVDKSYIEQEKERQFSEIARRIARYREILPRIDPHGRDVVITDDGIATGATFMVSLSILRRSGPSRLVAALPVGPEDNILKLEKDADEVICLKSPPFFAAVGQFYSHFSQVSDEEVIELLKQERTERDLKSK